MRSRTPASTRRFSRSVRMFFEISRLAAKSANRRVPANASRTTRSVHQSPRTSRARATEQFSRVNRRRILACLTCFSACKKWLHEKTRLSRLVSMTSEWKPTACILCECNCGLEVELGGDAGRPLVRLRGDKRHPSSRGYACEKAHRLDHYQHGRDRVLHPLRRRADGSFEEIDWDTAIREVAARLSAARDRHGGASIFYYGGGGQGNHLPGVYATTTRRTLGMRYRSSALAQEKTGEFWVSDRMLGGMTRADFEHADVALFLGKNPWHSHSIPRARVTLKELSKDPARTLIVVDPRRTETAELADIHLQVRPGGDAWLLAAMLAILVEEDLVDRAFLAAHVV